MIFPVLRQVEPQVGWLLLFGWLCVGVVGVVVVVVVCGCGCGCGVWSDTLKNSVCIGTTPANLFSMSSPRLTRTCTVVPHVTLSCVDVVLPVIVTTFVA